MDELMFVLQRKLINKMKRQPYNRRKYLQMM